MPFICPGFVHLHKWFRGNYKRKGLYPGGGGGGGGLKTRTKKRFETRNRIADTFCILFYWILFKLQNVKINQVYFNAFEYPSGLTIRCVFLLTGTV